MLAGNADEVDRHLASTKIGPREEDKRLRVEDYPLLPVRRRFWEKVLRSIDVQYGGATAHSAKQ